MERRLTADVAHELRTPLQAIQATVEAMQDGVLPADEERLGIVRDETVRLAPPRRRHPRAHAPRARLGRRSTCTRIDLAGPGARGASTRIEALIETCEIVLSVDIAEGVYVVRRLRPPAAGGRQPAQQRRALHAGGRQRRGDACAATAARRVIEVADTGIGIAEEDLDRGVLALLARRRRARDARAAGSASAWRSPRRSSSATRARSASRGARAAAACSRSGCRSPRSASVVAESRDSEGTVSRDRFFDRRSTCSSA